MKPGSFLPVVIIGIGAYILLSGGKKNEGGSESGGFQIPDFINSSGQPGAVYNIAAPTFTAPDIPQSKKESSAQTSYNQAISNGLTPIQIFGGGIDKGSGKAIIPAGNIINSGLGKVVPDSSFQKKSSSSGRYFAPTTYKYTKTVSTPSGKKLTTPPSHTWRK